VLFVKLLENVLLIFFSFELKQMNGPSLQRERKSTSHLSRQTDNIILV